MKKLIYLAIITIFGQFTYAENLIEYQSTPLAIVLMDRALLDNDEFSNMTLTQQVNHIENPNQILITLTESDLLDDSILAIQSVYDIHKNEQGWFLQEKQVSYQCRRGENITLFSKKICP